MITIAIPNPETETGGWTQTWDGTKVSIERREGEDSDISDWGGYEFYGDDWAEKFREQGTFLTVEEMIDCHNGAGFDAEIREGPKVPSMAIQWRLIEAMAQGKTGEELDALARELTSV